MQKTEEFLAKKIEICFNFLLYIFIISVGYLMSVTHSNE